MSTRPVASWSISPVRWNPETSSPCRATLARAMIRYLADDETIEVPSPTFTLMQTYDLPRFPLVHADLYRLSGTSELAELGFEDLPAGAVTLLEWPDRAGGVLPFDRLD